MSKVFFHPDGTPSPHPVSYEDARELRKLKYDDRKQCLTCKACSVKYTATQSCIHCARLYAIDFYNSAVRHVPWPEGQPISDDIHEAIDLLPQFVDAPSTPQDAVALECPVYVRVEPCTKAGHIGLRTPEGMCWFCRKSKRQLSPRQQAIAAGERWYTPADPCKRCGTTAPRRVDNGQCRGCAGAQGPAPQAQRSDLIRSIVESAPDMVMTRGDARAAGMPVYRTGKPCKYGHTAHRYVSTGACLVCVSEQHGRA